MLRRMIHLSDDALAEREMENTLQVSAACSAAAGEGWFRREGPLAWGWSELPIAFLNQVVPCGPGVSAAAVDRAVQALRATGDPFIARIRAGIDDGLVPQLKGLGLREDPDEAVPGMALHPLRAAALGAPDPEGLDLRTVDDLAGLASHQELVSEGFEMPLDAARRLVPPAILGVPSATIVVGSTGGVAATTAMAWTEGDTVGVFNVVTSEAFRRRGFGAAVTRAVLREGLRRGASVGILQSSPSGHGVYEALGFREVVRYRVFIGS